MADADFLGQGWRHPITHNEEGEIALSSGEDSIRESVILIIQTERGERVMRPEFGCGIHELAFAENNGSTAGLVAQLVREALIEFEPRIDVDFVTASPDQQERSRLNIEIQYTIRSINRQENLVYPFYLAG